MKRIALFLVFVLLMMPHTNGMIVGNQFVGAVSAPAADYVPATVELEFGQDRGVNVVCHIYNQSDFSKVTNGQSSAIGDAASGYVSGTFTNCAALTPGNKYTLAAMCDTDGMVLRKYDGGAWTLVNDAGLTYPTFPNTVNDENYDSANNFNFYVKNAGGDTLLSYTSGNANGYFTNNRAHFSTAGVTCATL